MTIRGSVFLSVVLAVTAASAAVGDEAAIRKQIERIKESDTNAWRKIPWTSSLLAGRRVSEREKRPMFLFTHDGNIETGRC
ncbi:MAG TPA: hypothetical protein VMG10_06730 [Gemmataceae bacterium]|nr:hypothetical protein [Gemmataceae bacterium]